MITAKLINPQIFYVDGNPTKFSNTLILEQDGVEIDRRDINLPYATPDSEIEEFVKQAAVNKAEEMKVPQEAQETLRWDWPSWDMVEPEISLDMVEAEVENGSP